MRSRRDLTFISIRYEPVLAAILRFVTGGVLLLESLRTLLHGGGSHADSAWFISALAATEILAAVLFLIPATFVAGGIVLLTTLIIAIIPHFAMLQIPFPLLVYTAAVLFLLAYRLRQKIPLGLAAEDITSVRAFESAAIPNSSFHHRDHVRMAWIYLRLYPLTEAMTRFSSALRRFAAAYGKESIYNETITWAYLLLVNERLERCGRDRTWSEFSDLNGDLLAWNESILKRYYRPETLQSPLAKRVFVMPDIG